MSESPIPNPQSPAVLITGGGKRVGRVIALQLAVQGWDIALHYHHSHKEAEATAAEIRALGRACEIFQADLEQPPGDLAARVQAALPGCNALVNNASVFERGGPFERHMAVNFHAPVLLAEAFLSLIPPPGRGRVGWGSASAQCGGERDPHLDPPPSRGRKKFAVVNILDAKITDATSPYFYYLLSKKALAEFTRQAAAEGKGRFNAVCPGVMLESSDGLHGAEYLQKEAAWRKSGRLGTPEEVAAAVHRLLTDESLNGQFITVDG